MIADEFDGLSRSARMWHESEKLEALVVFFFLSKRISCFEPNLLCCGLAEIFLSSFRNAFARYPFINNRYCQGACVQPLLHVTFV